MPISQELIESTLKTGIRPLELIYSPIYELSGSRTTAYRSILKINSVEFGELLPEQYRVVANRTQQCVKLAKWCIDEAYKELITAEETRIKVNYIMIYVPVKMLKDGCLTQYVIEKRKSEEKDYTRKLCFEFSDDILVADREEIQDELTKLHKQGVMIAISGYGSEFCPTMRIAGLPIDIVLLDGYIKESYIGGNEEACKSIISFLKGLKCTVVAECNEDEVESLRQMGCNCRLDGEVLRGVKK